MDILYIHGIAQESFTEEALEHVWTEALEKAAPGITQSKTRKMAYYGKALASWQPPAAVAMGASASATLMTDTAEQRFLSTALEELAAQQRIPEATIEAAMASMNAVPMDSFIRRRLVGLVRVIEKVSPLKGELILKVVKQGYTYLSSPAAAQEVDKIVQPLIEQGPRIIISHSLGTVIAFKLLRKMAEKSGSKELPLLITLGSPLSLEAFKAKLGPPRGKAEFVRSWENFYDRSDFVSLGQGLTEENFASGIRNDATVDNQTPNAHGIVGYLPHAGVIAAIKRALHE